MNIPNLLSVLRIFMVPVFLYFFFSEGPNGMTISFGIVILAGLTDILDGIIARKFHLITKLGIVLDPLADKMMLLAVLVGLTTKGILPIWILLVVAVKECTMILGALMLHNHHEVVMPANIYGKAATLAFYVAVLAVAFHNSYYMLFMVLFVLLTFFALVVYSNNFRKIKKEMKSEGADLERLETDGNLTTEKEMGPEHMEPSEHTECKPGADEVRYVENGVYKGDTRFRYRGKE